MSNSASRQGATPESLALIWRARRAHYQALRQYGAKLVSRIVAVRLGLLSASALLGGVLAVHAAPVEDLAGRYAFDAGRPDITRCVQVKGKLLTLLRSKTFVCERGWRSDSASGKPAIRCDRKHPMDQYFVLKTRADCEGERQTQAANGD